MVTIIVKSPERNVKIKALKNAWSEDETLEEQVDPEA